MDLAELYRSRYSQNFIRYKVAGLEYRDGP
jgi:hypothetical protein